MNLKEKRALFSREIARLVDWAGDNQEGYLVAFGEGYVTLTDAADGDYDGPHKKNGGHYSGLANDITIWLGRAPGQPVMLGSHPFYTTLGERWEALNATLGKQLGVVFSWGGRFRDPNHFSIEHNGVR